MPTTSIDTEPVLSVAWLVALVGLISVAYIVARLLGGPASQLSRRGPIYLLRTMLALLLVLLMCNPVRVTHRDGSIEPATAFFLLDASQSMAIGNESETRWDQATDMIRSATELAADDTLAEISLFRFGKRLGAIESAGQIELHSRIGSDGRGVTYVDGQTGDVDQTSTSKDETRRTIKADDPDTQMLVALRQLSSRFGRKPPNAIIVFSDGRARDAARLEEVAGYYADLGIPIHTVPIGDLETGGDVAFVSLVMPAEARRQSEIQAQAFLRSYGFDGQQVEIHINAIEADGSFIKRMTTQPVTLHSGFQPVSLRFRTDNEPRRLEAIVSKLPGELSTNNNRLETDLSILREKIRVLYFEGGSTFPDGTVGKPESRLKAALAADRDVQCVVVPVRGERAELTASDQSLVSPFSVTELAAFDAIILSNVPPKIFADEQLQWIQNWVQRRGGGFCMTGGPNSFGSWMGTPVDIMLPVRISKQDDWDESFRTKMLTDTRARVHPLFQILDDNNQNRDLFNDFPRCIGANVNLLPKPRISQVLAIAQANLPESDPGDDGPARVFPHDMDRWLADQLANPDDAAAEFAGITVGQFGQGRTLAIAVPITGPGSSELVNWGPGDSRNSHYGKFWRKAIYWLTERSFVGRRRLVAKTDKRYYEPGDTITLTAQAFSKTAAETADYRLVAMIEPQTFDKIESDYSTIRWPSNIPRQEKEEVPFAMWGEQIEVSVRRQGDRIFYQLELPVADVLPRGITNQSMRLELAAWQGRALVDSASVPIQILHDPFEQQNPIPDHQLLTRLAHQSGGQVLADDNALADLLASLPVNRGPATSNTTPLWNTPWMLALILGLISGEWCYRRWVGLA